MKATKQVTFEINGTPVEVVEDAAELTIEDIEKTKTALAAKYGIDFHKIDVITKDNEVQELSDCFLRTDGSLLWLPKHKTYPIVVQGISPAMDITHEELCEEFLDLITKKEFDKAIIFR